MTKAVLLPTVEPGWAAGIQLEPGAHLVIVTDNDTLSIEGRKAGLELRDTLAVVASEGSRFAVLFRKPIVEATIVAQVLATGTGAINIDGTRVGGEARTLNSYTSVGPQGCVNRPGETSHAGREYEARVTAQGRWPTNIVFVHGKGCLVAACEPGCPVVTLDIQSGVRSATLTGRADPDVTHTNPGDNHGASWFGGGNSNVYADSGGASRYYPQFANDAELFEWITRLITPPLEVS